MNSPLVSIVILNWNGKEHLQECLESVLRSTYAPLEIIFVDNGSTDGSVDYVRSGFPSVPVLENGKNLGYAEGNNKGIAVAKGKYVVTLNNDVNVEPDWLEKPVEYLENDDLLGVVGCRQMSYYNRSVGDGFFHSPSPELSFERVGHGVIYDLHSFLAVPGYVISVNGGSAIYRRELFIRLGGFDTNFFAYHDETDFCMRLFLDGWKCLYTPQAVVYHKDSASFKKAKGMKLYYSERNRLWSMFKYYPLSIILKHIIPIVIYELRIIKYHFLRGSTPLMYLKAKWDGMMGLSKYTSIRKKYTGKFLARRKEFSEFQKQQKIPL
jgi:GT2 family glycosyltransferase